MVFRLLEVCMGREWGLGFWTYLWDDGSAYSLAAFIHSGEAKKTYCSLLLYTFIIDWDAEEEDTED